MKIKLLAAVALLLGVVSFIPARASAVPASLLAANFTEVSVTTPGSPGCGVKVKHGPFSTTSVSQLVIAQSMTVCQNTSYVENIGLDDSGEFVVQRCYVGTGLGDTGSGLCGRSTSGTDNIYQSYIADTNFVGTKVHLCHASTGCHDYQYAPSYSKANPAHFVDQIIRETTDGNATDECRVNFSQGNFSTTALSRISYYVPSSGLCNTGTTWVEVTGVNTTNAQVQKQRCLLNGSDAGGDGSCSSYSGWVQANLTDSYIVSSTVQICNTITSPCDTEGGLRFFPGL